MPLLIMAAAIATSVSVHPGQLDVLVPAVNRDGPKTIIARAGIRGGKTEAGALATICRAINEPTAEDECHAVTSPTFAMAKLGPEPKLKKLLANRELFPVSPLVFHHKTDHAFYLKNRLGGLSRIRVFSGEDPDRWRGDAWRTWWADEGAYLSSEARDVGLGRLADSNGRLLVTTTPDGMNWVSEYSEECTEEEERWIIRAGADGRSMRVPYWVRRSADGRVLEVRWGSLANPFVKAAGFEELRQRYDEDTYAQEVDAAYVAKSGRVYKSFDRKRHMREIEKTAGVIRIGADFNVGRMAWLFLQDVPAKDKRQPGLHVFAEQEIRDTDTRAAAIKAKARLAELGIALERVVVHPDASGSKRQTAASDTARSDLHILRQLGFRVEAGSRNPFIKDRVNCVNGLLAHDRLSVSARCPLLLEALEKQPWDPDTDPVVPLKDGILDNRNDALGYACWARFPLRRETTIGRAA